MCGVLRLSRPLHQTDLQILSPGNTQRVFILCPLETLVHLGDFTLAISTPACPIAECVARPSLCLIPSQLKAVTPHWIRPSEYLILAYLLAIGGMNMQFEYRK